MYFVLGTKNRLNVQLEIIAENMLKVNHCEERWKQKSTEKQNDIKTTILSGKRKKKMLIVRTFTWGKNDVFISAKEIFTLFTSVYIVWI